MDFGNWELRDDATHYFSKDANIFPSSNAVDEGKLTTEENIRNIYRDLTTKNYVLKQHYFSLSINENRSGVIVSPGEAIIQGYHLVAKNSAEVKVPGVGASDGSYLGPIVQYTLGISLSYDAANHVTGDVVNKELPVGESEVLSGVYLKWFDECELECYYDNILVLGRAWVQAGRIVADGTKDGDRLIAHGFEIDPFKDHRYEANLVEVEVNGHRRTDYDTLVDNITEINSPLNSYDSMHYPIELIRGGRTKPPTFITDIQDFVNYIPDWYMSKYGDYMTGALRFNNLSIDGMREHLNKVVTKDGLGKATTDNLECSDSIIISPRTYGDLTRDITKTVSKQNYDYNVGGTILSIVPGTYPNSTDEKNGYVGNHVAMVSQKYGETGLRIHATDGNNQGHQGTTRIVHYTKKDNGQNYDKSHNSSGGYDNTSKFIIENVDDSGRTTSINMKNGEVFFDSFTHKIDSKTFEENGYNGKGTYYGSGFQFYTQGDGTDPNTNVDFRIDEDKISIAKHDKANHRNGNRGTNHTGNKTDDLYYEVGVGVDYDSSVSRNNTLGLYTYSVTSKSKAYPDPYMSLGNLRVRSNDISNNNVNVKQNTIEVINIGSTTDSTKTLPYVRIKPRVYSEQYLAEEIVQVGTTKIDDYVGNNAQNNAGDKVIIKHVNVNSEKDSTNPGYTVIEQDYTTKDNTTKALIKTRPPISKNKFDYSEINGLYSNGNIGCSDAKITPLSNESNSGYDKDNPYSNDNEWVRFTRFRYDNDKDRVNGGTYTGNHEDGSGRLYGNPYNLEFNTQVANKRANQIIWRYRGSTGKQDATQIDNTPPVMLSYIHDTTTITGSKATKYTDWNDADNPGYNSGKGTFETYIDHNGTKHFNPTYKIRDILLLENAGLSISGDINNPSLAGDSLNESNHLGVTILNGRVYNAVYNDFAETYEKDNIDDIAKPGDIISLNPETGKYIICETYNDNLVVGVQSNTYAFLAGGNRVNQTQDLVQLDNEYFTVGIAGKVWVNVVKDSNIKPGDMLTSSYEKGKACKCEYRRPGSILGKSLTKPKYFEDENEYKVLMQIMLS